MSLVVCVDGLSADDLSSLFDYLPNSSKLLKPFGVHYLDSVFTASQPIWAELLTGSPWFKNGCVGYSRPTDSLNHLEVFGETDLAEPVRLFHEDKELPAVVINVPLTGPNTQSGRVWLSDGSLPIRKVVSPASLKEERLFASYMPRAFPTIALADGTESEQIQKCLQIEQQRLRCALSLFRKRNWSEFVYRLNIFDQLSHFLGLNFLSARDLSVFPRIREFLCDLDNALQEFLSERAAQFCLISAFSHVACRGVLNINRLLHQGGFLSIDTGLSTASREGTGRIKLSAALLQADSSLQEPQLASMQGRLLTAATVAASPVSGCVFINRKRSFADGLVSDEDYQETRTTVGAYLRSELSRLFGGFHRVEENPDPSPSLNVAIPEFIVKIDGVELHDLEASALIGPPRTTHCSKGFVLFPKGRYPSENINPVQLASMLEG